MKELLQLIRFLFIKQDIMKVYYIQRDDVLPKPLGKEEGLTVLIALENGDKEARNTLIEHNLRLVVYIAKHYETNPIFMEGPISVGSIGLIKAVSTLKRDKNIKLMAYALRCVENEILMFLHKKGRRKVKVSFGGPLSVDYDGNELPFPDILGTDDDAMTEELEKKENKWELLEVMSTLKEQERQILQMRYGTQHEELTWKGIAKRLSISQSYISRLEKRITAKPKIQMKSSQ